MLRKYKPSDLQTLYAIDSACFPPDISYSLNELRRFISHRRARTWVAVEDGKTIGFAVAQKLNAQVVHLVTIDVVESMRGRGAGSELMDAVEAWARCEGSRAISLETAEDNVGAQAFYERRGYQKLERVPGYYGNGAAAWAMFKIVES